MLETTELGVETLSFAHKLPAKVDGTPHVSGELLGPYLCLCDKWKGSDPGAVVVSWPEDEPDQIALYIALYNVMQDVLELPQLVENISRFDDARRLFSTALSQLNHGALEDFVDRISKDRPVFQLKARYADPENPGGDVTIPRHAALRTSAIKSLPKISQQSAASIYCRKRRTPLMEENLNVVLECLANELTYAYGQKCQQQSLIFDSYSTGDLKINSRSIWQTGLESFDDSMVFMGGDYKHGNYMVHGSASQSVEHDEFGFVHAVHIPKMGVDVPLYLLQGDRDVLGSKGQNKGLIENEVFGFDFGHSFRGDNPIVPSMHQDFSFTQPGGHGFFKNMDALYDNPLSEKMQGFHYLRALITGELPSTQVMDSYDDDFRERLLAITSSHPPSPFDQIFKKYIDKFTALAEEARSSADLSADERGRIPEQCLMIVNNIQSMKAKVMENFQNMQEVLGERKMLTREELDLVENLEKLTSKSYLCAPNGQVILNHIRVESKDRIPWRMEKNNGSYVLKSSMSASTEKALNAYGQYWKEMGYEGTPFEQSYMDGQLTLTFSEQKLSLVAKFFDETRIMHHKHPAQFLRLAQNQGVELSSAPQPVGSVKPAVIRSSLFAPVIKEMRATPLFQVQEEAHQAQEEQPQWLKSRQTMVLYRDFSRIYHDTRNSFTSRFRRGNRHHWIQSIEKQIHACLNAQGKDDFNQSLTELLENLEDIQTQIGHEKRFGSGDSNQKTSVLFKLCHELEMQLPDPDVSYVANPLWTPH